MGIFEYKSKFSGAMRRLWDIVVLSTLWTIFSLPLITIGITSTALYYTLVKYVIEEKSYLNREFFHGMKLNWKQGLLTQLLFLIAGFIFIWEGHFCYEQLKAGENYGGFYVLFLILTIVLIILGVFTYAYMARFERSFWGTIHDSFIIMITHPVMILRIIVVFVIGGGLIYVIPIALMFVPMIGMWWIAVHMEKIFSRYINRETSEKESEEQNEAEG